MTLFRLDASIRVQGSASREIADIVVDEWLAAHPGDRVERRHIGVDVLPADAWAHAVIAMYLPESDAARSRSPPSLWRPRCSTSCCPQTLSCWPFRFTTMASRSTSRPGWT